MDALGTGDVCSRYRIEQYSGHLALADVHPMDEPAHFAFAVRAVSGLIEYLNAFIRYHPVRWGCKGR